MFCSWCSHITIFFLLVEIPHSTSWSYARQHVELSRRQTCHGSLRRSRNRSDSPQHLTWNISQQLFEAAINNLIRRSTKERECNWDGESILLIITPLGALRVGKMEIKRMGERERFSRFSLYFLLPCWLTVHVLYRNGEGEKEGK